MISLALHVPVQSLRHLEHVLSDPMAYPLSQVIQISPIHSKHPSLQGEEHDFAV